MRNHRPSFLQSILTIFQSQTSLPLQLLLISCSHQQQLNKFLFLRNEARGERLLQTADLTSTSSEPGASPLLAFGADNSLFSEGRGRLSCAVRWSLIRDASSTFSRMATTKNVSRQCQRPESRDQPPPPPLAGPPLYARKGLLSIYYRAVLSHRNTEQVVLNFPIAIFKKQKQAMLISNIFNLIYTLSLNNMGLNRWVHVCIHGFPPINTVNASSLPYDLLITVL